MAGREPKKKVNTVRFQYPFGAARPKEDEFAALLKSKDVEAAHVVAIYPEATRRSILVKFESKELAEGFMNKVGYSVEFEYSNKVSVELKVSDADVEVTMLRVFELQPEIEDDEIVQVFKAYGDVKKVLQEKTSLSSGYSVYNGVRRVFIERNKDIPNLVQVDGRLRRVFYEGQKEICFRCSKEGHKRFECTESANNRLRRTAIVPGSAKNNGEAAKLGKNYDGNFPPLPNDVITVHSDDETGDKNKSVEAAPSSSSTTATLDNNAADSLVSVVPATDTNNAGDTPIDTNDSPIGTAPTTAATSTKQTANLNQIATTNKTVDGAAVSPFVQPLTPTKRRKGRTAKRTKSGDGSSDGHVEKKRNTSTDNVANRTRSSSRSSVASMDDDEQL